jgi:hypothetical protein
VDSAVGFEALEFGLSFRGQAAQARNRFLIPSVGLKETRAKREEAKKLLASGFDPSQQKRLVKLASESQKADTFEAISREVLEKKRREGKSETTVSKAEWLFDLATPALGSRPIAEITAPEVLAVLRQIETKGRLETARRLRAIIGQAFRRRGNGPRYE